VDRIEQGDGILGLVGLELADQMEGDIRMGFAQAGPFALGLLHAILAEQALTGSDERRDRVGFMRLADCDELDRASLAARDTLRAGDRLAHGGEALRSRFVLHETICPFIGVAIRAAMRQGQGKLCGDVSFLPCVWLMTDERVAEADLLRAVSRLPAGSAVIVRHYGLEEAARRRLFDQVRRIARRRGILVLLAGDPALALGWGADGHHGRTPHRFGGWLHSAPVHNMAELRLAVHAGADVVLLSPLFATRSHPGARPLGAMRFAALARLSPVPVIALGGVKPRHAALVRRLGASGFAAIDGLVRRRA
jgi:thiamine-phosphate pyrophosphorylase